MAPAPLPRVLCLHGSGGNTKVFDLQARRITSSRVTGTRPCQTFNFVFINGPFETPAGPGVLPFFEGAGPFWSWVYDPDAKGSDGQDDAQRNAMRKTLWDHLMKILNDEGKTAAEKAKLGPWVGIMAFSQGTRVVTGMMTEMYRVWNANGAKEEDKPWPKWAILMGAAYPPVPFTGLLQPVEEGLETNRSAATEETKAHESKALSDALASLNVDNETAAALSAPSTAENSEQVSPAASTPISTPGSPDVDTWGYPKTNHTFHLPIPSLHVQGNSDIWFQGGQDLRKKHYEPDLATYIEFIGPHRVPAGQKEIDGIARWLFDAHNGKI